MKKETFKQKTNRTLKEEWDKTQKNIGYFSALNDLENILTKDDCFESVRAKLNKLRFGKR